MTHVPSKLLLQTLKRAASSHELELTRQNMARETGNFLDYLSRQCRLINDNVPSGRVNFAEFYDAVWAAHAALNDQINDLKGRAESREAGDL